MPWRSMGLGGLVEGLSLALLVPLLAVVTDSQGALGGRADLVFAELGADPPMRRLAVTLVAFLAVMTLRGLVLAARDRTLTALRVRYTEHRRSRLLNALAGASWHEVAELRHARIVSALGSEVARVALAAHAILNMALAAVMLAAQLALTMAISWVVGSLALGLMGLAALVSIGRLRLASRYGEDLRREGLNMTHSSGQLLGGLKHAAAENRQGVFAADFGAAGREMVAFQISHQRRSTRFFFVVSVATACAASVVLLGGVWSGADGVALVACLLVLSRMVGHVVSLQRDAENLASSLPGHRMIAELEAELARDAVPVVPVGPTPEGEIRLDRVGYRHDDGSGGVEEVSLRIRPGEIVGLSGPSGAGKTTLLDLIIGLLPPQSGTVAVGGTALDPAAAWRWRNRIAYVGQDAFLSNDTVRRNLAPDAGARGDDGVLWRALEQAAVAEVVRSMPEGLDTVLAERGGRLSGGERQRIAIARAILRRPALMILDEATNAIDVPTERRVLEALTSLGGDMILLIVAHRGETLAPCSRILTMAAGRLVGDESRAA